jgi:hypothetical protein
MLTLGLEGIGIFIQGRREVLTDIFHGDLESTPLFVDIAMCEELLDI